MNKTTLKITYKYINYNEIKIMFIELPYTNDYFDNIIYQNNSYTCDIYKKLYEEIINEHFNINTKIISIELT